MSFFQLANDLLNEKNVSVLTAQQQLLVTQIRNINRAIFPLLWFSYRIQCPPTWPKLSFTLICKQTTRCPLTSSLSWVWISSCNSTICSLLLPKSDANKQQQMNMGRCRRSTRRVSTDTDVGPVMRCILIVSCSPGPKAGVWPSWSLTTTETKQPVRLSITWKHTIKIMLKGGGTKWLSAGPADRLQK